MNTLHELSEQISEQHPDLAASVDKVFENISELYYGMGETGFLADGRRILTLRDMLRAGSKRIDQIEFYLSFFQADLRAAFLIKLAMKFKGLDQVWYHIRRIGIFSQESAVEDRQQIDFLYSLFISWVDDNLPLIMEGSYVSRGGWF